MVRGVTPLLVGGSGPGDAASPYYAGLNDLFTTISGSLVNINTASPVTLQVIPQIDENIAFAIISARAGPDGVEGNEDDTPFRSPQEIAYRVPGFNPQIAALVAQLFTVRSPVFETRVDVWLDNQHRGYVALLRRHHDRKIEVISFAWE